MQLPRLRQKRQSPPLTPRPQQAAGVPRIMPRNDCRVENLLKGVAPRFAGFELDEIERFVLPFQKQVVEAQEDAGAVPGAEGPPRGLRRTSTPNRQRHVGLAA